MCIYCKHQKHGNITWQTLVYSGLMDSQDPYSRQILLYIYTTNGWTPFLLHRVYFPFHHASPTVLSNHTPLLPLTIMLLSQLLPPHHHSSETGKSLQYRVSESYCHLLVRRLSTSDW